MPMKHKLKFLADELHSSKKKHSKLHDFSYRPEIAEFVETGIVTDKFGNPINIGDVVKTFINEKKELLECEVIEIHAGDILTVIHDSERTDNQVVTYNVQARNTEVLR